MVELGILLDAPLALILVVLVVLDVLFVFVILFVERDDPTRVLTWLLILIYEPFIGAVLFLLFHHDYRCKVLHDGRLEVDALEHRVSVHPDHRDTGASVN